VADEAEWVVVADILRPRGNRGQLLAASQTDVPGRLESLRTAHVHLTDGSDIPVDIESAWAHKEFWVLKFAGIESISAAERFRGAELRVPMERRGKLADGEYFQSDLIGCEVIERVSGRELGKVEGFEQCGGPPLMEVLVGGREVLIPFVPSICREVDLAGRKIMVDLPEGLLEL
jgi:16S rRNA processing protein RimM